MFFSRQAAKLVCTLNLVFNPVKSCNFLKLLGLFSSVTQIHGFKDRQKNKQGKGNKEEEMKIQRLQQFSRNNTRKLKRIAFLHSTEVHRVLPKTELKIIDFPHINCLSWWHFKDTDTKFRFTLCVQALLFSTSSFQMLLQENTMRNVTTE